MSFQEPEAYGLADPTTGQRLIGPGPEGDMQAYILRHSLFPGEYVWIYHWPCSPQQLSLFSHFEGSDSPSVAA